MPRLPISLLTRGIGVCVVLLVLLYMYMALRGEVFRQGTHDLCQQGPLDQGKPATAPSTYQHGSLDKKETVHIPPKDVHLPSFLKVVDPVSLSTNKGAINNSCIRTRTNPAFHICVYPRQQDVYVSGSLVSSGVWEAQITNRFQLALRKFPQATVINAGANIGYYSLMAAVMGHPVIAVEPTTASMEKLAQGIRLNGVADKVYVLQNAVAESHRNVSMAVNGNNQGGINVLENKNNQHTVQTILMDDLIPLIHTRDVIIMMDIEVYECRAIAGSTKLFQHVNVTYIFMEWMGIRNFRHRPDTPCPIDAIRRMTEGHFHRLGYIAHDMGTNKVLDPHGSPDWQSSDVYWRYKDHPPLIP